ncbi:chemotaxis protein CheA [Hydrogenovibrio marinus]|uniref:Chemotaxis protein CheA n=1 Tax=Hydrogenovibrio marinus TaxID=28885 RepID=A0A066ZXH8_HYDMR|nr:chemotaxis protein CheA [Hydrogenovibrio marinus]KDN94800.1 chemotaxis protein CheA [Hydrogenovibrio marinus]BBN59258.1 chemotaxis protein CheA [Hydrogenovibrio marinus]
MDEEILQDFLIEASELVEQLDEQLTDLANSPTDSDLLNAIFRGFHTIKGGAGFLGVTPLIEVCHRAENVFDKIRNDEVAYDNVASDVIMRAFDVISDYIEQLKDGARELEEADDGLLAELDALWRGQAATASHEEEIATPEAEVAPSQPEVKLQLAEGVDPDGDISDDEFEALLNQRDSLSISADEEPEATSASGVKLQLEEGLDPDGDITDDEFEALLNQRDMLGLDEPSAPAESPQPAPAPKPAAAPQPAPAPKPAAAPQPAPAPKPAAKEDDGDKGEDKPSKAAAESTVRVDTRRLDEIMNLVGELVLVRNRLLTLKSLEDAQEELSNAVGNLDHVTTDLQTSVMKTRMQPVKKVFGRFPRVVRDLARKLGKEIELELQGEETDLDKNLVEALADPLVHLVRNSVDHGIEMPSDRENANKPRKGTVILAAEQEGDHILLSITDDGKGMDPDVLRRKAVEKGMMDEVSANQLDDKAAFELIMSAGFSTAETISDISGRGVGMDVVKNMITKLNGSIDIHSVLGKGTQINIRVPLTLAILPTLMVSFGEDSYAIPLTSVQEIFDFDSDQTNKIDGQMMVRLREKSIPLIFLSEWLSPECDKTTYDGDKVIIVSIGNQRAGFVVDQVNGQEEVVIKPLGVMMKHIEGYAGATITGNGNIALILDLPGVIQRFQY